MKIKLIFLIAVVFLAGCASTITGKPGDADGIAYYMPRPYFLITKNIDHAPSKIGKTEPKKNSEEKKVIKKTSIQAENKKRDFYQFQVIYLPDLTQKRSLKIISRTGKIDTKITLKDGWQLTGINLDADADTAGIITAFASAIPSIAGLTKSKDITEVVPKINDKEAGLWLYEISAENGRLKYELVLQWPPGR